MGISIPLLVAGEQADYFAWSDGDWEYISADGLSLIVFLL